MLPARRSSRALDAGTDPMADPSAAAIHRERAVHPAGTHLEPFDWAARTGEHPLVSTEDERDAEYRRTSNRPAGLPASVRLPAEVPDNLWPPAGLLETHTAENAPWPDAVESAAEPRAESQDATAELEVVQARTESPAEAPADEPDAKHDANPEPATEADHPQEVHDHHRDPHDEFIPDVMARGDGSGDDDGDDYAATHARTASIARHAAPSAATRRKIRRRRRAMLVAYAIVIAVVLGAGHQLRNGDQPPAQAPEAAQPAAEPTEVTDEGEIGSVQSVAEPPEEKEPKKAEEPKGKGEFRYAKARGPMLGEAGPVRRFQVAVEESVGGTSPAEFAEVIEETLGDDRSWVHDGRMRMRRVPKSADNADFTIFLASARTSEEMCATGGLQTEGYTSCRVPGKVVINAARWNDAVPDYAGKIAEYRRYAINHEVGHELGHGHEQCPGEGKRAPVMMPQTYGLKGCTRNAWPYLDGKRYSGEPMR